MLNDIITSKTRIRLLIRFFLNPQCKSYLRELAAEFGTSPNGIREELQTDGRVHKLLQVRKEGRQLVYQANTSHPLFPELHSMVEKALGMDQIHEKIITGLGDLEVAYLLDDYAEGRDTGVMDLLLVGNINHYHLNDLSRKTERYIERKIRSLVLSVRSSSKCSHDWSPDHGCCSGAGATRVNLNDGAAGWRATRVCCCNGYFLMATCRQMGNSMHCPNLTELPPPPSGKKGWPWTEATPRLPDTMPDGPPWPRISIVTPSLNQGRYIEETIRSVLLQGYPDLEYIIIDGGSTDNSLEVIQKYAPWLTYWVSEPDKGQSHAINKGWRHSTGGFIGWLCADDILLPSAVAQAVRFIGARPGL